MRPLCLTMEAFGPFQGQQRIDFTVLGDQRLFLIEGDTGSGKTTIFDAMCAALYGKTSVGRSVEHMKCLSAVPGAVCRLEFSFQVGERLFRIERIPEQKRLAIRGNKVTSQVHSATLWETIDGKDHVIATKVGAVTDHIQTILGLSVDQFCQVVLLPQGRFEKMLRATASEREKILQILFQTDRYLAIQERLEEDARQAESAVKEALSRREQILQAIGCTTSEELLQQHASKLAELNDAEALRTKVNTSLTAARMALEGGREIKRKLDEQADAERAYLNLLQQEPAIQIDRKTIEHAHHALHIEGTEAQFSAAVLDEQEARQALENKQRMLDFLRLEKEQSEHQHIKEEQKLSEHLQIQENITRLESLKTVVAEFTRLQADVQSANDKVNAERQRLLVAEAHLVNLEEALDRKKEQQTALSQLVSSYEDQRQALQRTLAMIERRQQVQLLREAIEKVKQKLSAARQQQIEKEKDKAMAREKYVQAQTAWIHSQAAELARTLKPGKPCPVCGSPDHPQPVHTSVDTVELTEIKRLQANLEESEIGMERALAKVHDYDQELANLTGREQTLSDGQETSNTDILEEHETSRRRIVTIKAAQNELPELITAIAKLNEAKDQQKQDCETLRRCVLQCEVHLATVRGRLEQRNADVEPQHRSLADLLLSLDIEKNKLQSLKETFKKTQEAATHSREKYARQCEAVLGAEEAYKKAEQLTHLLRDKLAKDISALGFSSEADYQQAKRSREEIKTLENKVIHFDETLATERGRYRRAQESAQGLTLPDLDALQEKVDTLVDHLKQADIHLGALANSISLMTKSLHRLQELQNELACREGQSSSLRRLANIATGAEPKNPGFHRFVLAERLDEVLFAANRRLGPMSEERYRLERVREEENQRISPGLNLEVMDGYSGKTRPIDTLSGGESFLAALSLALGLADVVQQHAGGVKLDTVFVDEGFGSLDPNALDLAMRCLEDLRQTGRLVGVISHVAEMKERIRHAQLRVKNTHGISEAQFVIAS